MVSPRKRSCAASISQRNGMFVREREREREKERERERESVKRIHLDEDSNQRLQVLYTDKSSVKLALTFRPLSTQ